jgi:hypothetical protein
MWVINHDLNTADEGQINLFSGEVLSLKARVLPGCMPLL